MPSNSKGRFGKQDFVYVAADDVYLYPASEQLTYHYSNEEDGKILRRYWTTACQACALKGLKSVIAWGSETVPRFVILDR